MTDKWVTKMCDFQVSLSSVTPGGGGGGGLFTSLTVAMACTAPGNKTFCPDSPPRPPLYPVEYPYNLLDLTGFDQGAAFRWG